MPGRVIGTDFIGSNKLGGTMDAGESASRQLAIGMAVKAAGFIVRKDQARTGRYATRGVHIMAGILSHNRRPCGGAMAEDKYIQYAALVAGIAAASQSQMPGIFINAIDQCVRKGVFMDDAAMHRVLDKTIQRVRLTMKAEAGNGNDSNRPDVP
jgi:hypothetical protein